MTPQNEPDSVSQPSERSTHLTPLAFTLGEIPTTELEHDELIRYRFLSKEGALLFVGPTGIGKSTFIMQMIVSFSVGLPVFGLIPSRPLTSVLIQAENDSGDLIEMRDGAIHGLNLTAQQIEIAFKGIHVCSENAKTGRKFISEVLEPVLNRFRPDLVVIDPLLAYLGDDMLNQEAVGHFTRGMLSPLLKRFRCGLIVAHHTNKSSNPMSMGNAYVAAGSAELSNWPRAIITLMPVKGKNLFNLSLAKRGNKAGWKETDGVTPSLVKTLSQSREGTRLFWTEVTEVARAELEVSSAKSRSKRASLLAILRAKKETTLAELISSAKQKNIGENLTKRLINILVGEQILKKSERPRSGTRGEIILTFVQEEGVPSAEIDMINMDDKDDLR